MHFLKDYTSNPKQVKALILIIILFLLPFIANTGLYAHYVFNTLDKEHTGTLSFEVSYRINSYAFNSI